MVRSLWIEYAGAVYTRVSQAIGEVKRNRDRRLERLRRKLVRLESEPQ